MSQTESIDLLRREAAVLGELFASGQLQALYHAKDKHFIAPFAPGGAARLRALLQLTR